MDEALTAVAAALARDPADFESNHLCTRALFVQGRMYRAARLAEHAAGLRMDDCRAPCMAGKIFWGVGTADRSSSIARRSLTRARRRLEEDPGERRAQQLVSRFLVLLGEAEEGRAALAAHTGAAGRPAFQRVATLAMLGHVEEALAELESVVDGGWRDGVWLRADPALAALRSEPRFQRIAARLGAR